MKASEVLQVIKDALAKAHLQIQNIGCPRVNLLGTILPLPSGEESSCGWTPA